MASVYTVRLFPFNFVAGTYSVFTAPSGLTTVLRDVEWVSQSAAGFAQLYIPGVLILSTFTWSAANVEGRWVGRQVIEPGESVSLYCTGTVAGVTTGYRLN